LADFALTAFFRRWLFILAGPLFVLQPSVVLLYDNHTNGVKRKPILQPPANMVV
jgi:hypothetical protein